MTSAQKNIRGAFQPPTIDEIERLRSSLESGAKVTVILESWKASRGLRTPFSVEEREQLIRGALGSDAAKIHFVYAPDDFYRTRYSEMPTEARSALVWKDQSEVRDNFLRTGSLTGIPAENRKWLQNFASSELYRRLREERLAVDEYRDSWKAAPYEPIFVTVDALVTKDDQVLMIRRGHAPGKGLLALPGGFIEADEPLLVSALRELDEETAFQIEGVDLRDRLESVRVFSEPKRSARGRTISHVHHFALRETDPEPKIHAGDDASDAFWMRLTEIREEEGFEDHFLILHALLMTDEDGS